MICLRSVSAASVPSSSVVVVVVVPAYLPHSLGIHLFRYLPMPSLIVIPTSLKNMSHSIAGDEFFRRLVTCVSMLASSQAGISPGNRFFRLVLSEMMMMRCAE